jgi:nucleotide-binding universal stress UspA family protein
MLKPIQRLVRAVRDFLEEESRILGRVPEAAAGEGAAADLERARHRLENEISRYEQTQTQDFAFRHVLVAIDSSEQAGWAVDAAGRIARDVGAKVTLLHVAGIPVGVRPEVAYILPPPDSASREHVADLLARAADRIPEGVECEQSVSEGDPARQIIDAAKELGADLIVMGRHARGGIARFFLGSVAEAVVRQAHCPVLTMGHPAELEVLPFALSAEEAEAVSKA